MENTRTEELRRMHASVKAKLMSAVAMLLVATILMSSTTYAWFVLSTAPEVSGMTTTVGSNGALEIALLDDLAAKQDGSYETYQEMLNSITSGVGDSSSVNDLSDANVTWGNLVDLADDSYGLSDVKLYPAALNLLGANGVYTGTFADAGRYLRTPVYGVDGRVASLEDNTYAGKKSGSIFMYDANYYGVRAIGKYSNADPTAAELLAAQTGYANNYRYATTAAANQVLSDANAAGLTRLMVKQALDGRASNPINMTVTDADLASISNAVAGVKTVADYLEAAIKYGIVAEDIKNNGENYTLSFESVKLADYTSSTTWGALITELSNLRSSIATAQTLVAAATKDDYEDALDALMDVETMKIGGETIEGIKQIAEVEEWATQLLNDALIEVNGADSLLVKAANMISMFKSSKYDVQLDDEKSYYTMKDATIQVNQSTATEATVVAMGRIVAAYQMPNNAGEGGEDSSEPDAGTDTGTGENAAVSAKPTIMPDNTYGYVVDLAFRASVKTNLQLSAAQARVKGSTDESVQGGGSKVTIVTDLADVPAKSLNDFVNAFRVVFFNTENLQIVGVATMSKDENAASQTEYDLIMREFSFNADGALVVGLPKGQSYDEEGAVTGTATSDIMELQADTPVGLSVLVYLDGNYVDSSMAQIDAKLNLQFSSSESLTPMTYSGYVTKYDAKIAWAGEADDTSRPESVTVGLYAGDDTTAIQTAVLNSDNDWSYTFGGLATNDESGVPIEYSVKLEESVSGYTDSIVGSVITLTKSGS